MKIIVLSTEDDSQELVDFETGEVLRPSSLRDKTIKNAYLDTMVEVGNVIVFSLE